MSVDINGTTGVTTPGLASTAMPTSGGDPVVESGSNTDGEWTRWADGTQVCSTQGNLVELSSTVVLREWTYPIAFSAGPAVMLEVDIDRGTVPAAADEWATRVGIGGVDPLLKTNLIAHLITGTTIGSGDVLFGHATATGRWK